MEHFSYDRHIISVGTPDCPFLEYFNARPSDSNVRIQNNIFRIYFLRGIIRLYIFFKLTLKLS